MRCERSRRLPSESESRGDALGDSLSVTIQLSRICRLASAAGRVRGTGALAARRRDASYDDRFSPHGLEPLSEADDTRIDPVGNADVDEHDMILGVIDHPVESCNQIGVATAAQTALEDRKLYPFSESLHQLEHAAPTLRVGDVVDDDVEVLHRITAS